MYLKICSIFLHRSYILCTVLLFLLCILTFPLLLFIASLAHVSVLIYVLSFLPQVLKVRMFTVNNFLVVNDQNLLLHFSWIILFILVKTQDLLGQYIKKFLLSQWNLNSFCPFFFFNSDFCFQLCSRKEGGHPLRLPLFSGCHTGQFCARAVPSRETALGNRATDLVPQKDLALN